jgi:dUTP pyrophosphatase
MAKLTIEFVLPETAELYRLGAKNYQSDSGFDLYCPHDIVIPAMSVGFKLDLQIKLMLTDADGKGKPFMLVPRSSMGAKTPLRLSNSVGIIDREYRGNIIGLIDNISKEYFIAKKGDRLLQIVPFDGEGVGSVSFGDVNETIRGTSGLGSTGQ